MTPSLLLLAVALAADAFAVAVAQGVAARERPWRTALVVALAFGVAQALAPLMGWAVGRTFVGLIESWDHWVAFGILAGIGAKMIWDGNRPKRGQAAADRPAGGWALLMLAVATAIDAAAAGIALPTLGAPVVTSIAVIGLVTFALSFAGVWIGRAGSGAVGPNATIIGGLILIVIGAKVLIDHKAFG